MEISELKRYIFQTLKSIKMNPSLAGENMKTPTTVFFLFFVQT